MWWVTRWTLRVMLACWFTSPWEGEGGERGAAARHPVSLALPALSYLRGGTVLLTLPDASSWRRGQNVVCLVAIKENKFDIKVGAAHLGCAEHGALIQAAIIPWCPTATSLQYQWYFPFISTLRRISEEFKIVSDNYYCYVDKTTLRNIDFLDYICVGDVCGF